MSVQHNNLRHILESGEWTEEQKQWLRDYLEKGDLSELSEMMEDELRLRLEAGEIEPDERSAEDLEMIHQRIGAPERKSVIRRLWPKLAVAAAAIVLIVVLLVPKTNNRSTPGLAKQQKAVPSNDVAPGSNKAMLTLADGSVIMLNDAENGNLSTQGGTKVLKFDGKLSYDQPENASEVVYNKISTPRGGQYQIILPDGSRVWLNAESSIRFPTSFVGAERRVEITGEAYFEVAKKEGMQFIVQMPRSEVRVLGTHFNVMAYENEETQRTTLLEGSIRFKSGKDSSLMQPGQQSRLAKDGRLTVRNDINIDAVMAWKNGYFHFEKADIQTIMRQLARWYDIEVTYEGSPVKGSFHADIPKNTNLSVALQALNLTGKVHFQINNKQVTVTP